MQYDVALQEHQLESTVTAGENRCTLLNHDYVVRQWLGPFKLAAMHEILRSANELIASLGAPSEQSFKTPWPI